MQRSKRRAALESSTMKFWSTRLHTGWPECRWRRHQNRLLGHGPQHALPAGSEPQWGLQQVRHLAIAHPVQFIQSRSWIASGHTCM